MTLNYQITDDGTIKKLVSEDYNYVFNRDMNIMLRWGATKQENPVWDPYGPELMFIDVKNMPMELYAVIIDTITSNRTITTANLLNLVDEDMWKGYYLYGMSKDILVTAFPSEVEEEEAGFFSLYVSNEGIVRPVSSYGEGIDIMSISNLYTDVWQSPLFKKYRWERMAEMAGK